MIKSDNDKIEDIHVRYKNVIVTVADNYLSVIIAMAFYDRNELCLYQSDDVLNVLKSLSLTCL